MTLYEPYVPDDFDAFWHETVEAAMEAVLDGGREPSEYPETADHKVDSVSFRGIGGGKIFGWIAVPPDRDKVPAFLWVPPYGRESLLPNAYGTREGLASLSFNFFGEGAFHQEKYTPVRGYFSQGVSDRHTWVFKEMFQNAVLAARFLRAQPEVDPNRVSAMGMSQGAGISIWLGAWVGFIKAVCADMPFLAAMRATLSHKVHRYPLKELVDFAGTHSAGQEGVLHTLSYFDTVNMATRCSKPTQLSLGLKDPAARPANVEAAFEALTGPKLLRTYEVGHDWFPPMIQHNRDWLLENG